MRKTVIPVLVVLILIIGLIIGVLVVQRGVLFRPKAYLGQTGNLNYTLDPGWNYIGLPFQIDPTTTLTPANLLAQTQGKCLAMAEYLPPSGSNPAGRFKFYYGDSRPNPTPVLDQISGGHNYFVWCSQAANLILSGDAIGWADMLSSPSNRIDSLGTIRDQFTYFFTPLPFNSPGSVPANTASAFIREADAQLSPGKAGTCLRLYRLTNNNWQWFQEGADGSGIDFPIDRTRGHILTCTLPVPTPTASPALSQAATTPSLSPVPTATVTPPTAPIATQTPTATSVPTATATQAPAATATPSPTNVPTPIPTATQTPPAASATPNPTPTALPTPPLFPFIL